MLHVSVQKARCLQLTTSSREGGEGSRPITPHLLLLVFLCITGLEPSWSALCFTFSIFPNFASPSVQKQLVSLQLPSVLKPSLVSLPPLPHPGYVLSDKSLDYTVEQRPFICLPPIMLSLSLFPPSTFVTDLCLFSFHVLPSSRAPLRTHRLSPCASVCAAELVQLARGPGCVTEWSSRGTLTWSRHSLIFSLQSRLYYSTPKPKCPDPAEEHSFTANQQEKCWISCSSVRPTESDRSVSGGKHRDRQSFFLK